MFTCLLPAIEEEFVGINTIGDGTSYNGYPMENDWRLLWISEQELAKDIKDDSKDNERSKTCGSDDAYRSVGKQIMQRLSHEPKETHFLKRLTQDAELCEMSYNSSNALVPAMSKILGSVGIFLADITPLADDD